MRSLSVTKISSFEQANRDEMDYYLALTPEERFTISFELLKRYFGPPETWTGARDVPPSKIKHYQPTESLIK